MSKRQHSKRSGGRTTPKGTRPPEARHRRPSYDDPDPVAELVAGIRPLLAAPTALHLLEQASGLVEIVTDRPLDRFGSERSDRVDGPDFLGSLIGSGWPELVVFGKAMATLLPDQPIVRTLRSQPLPPGSPAWASTMDTIEVTGTFVQADPLGDGDNLWVCVRWPDGSEATTIMFVDHNMGSMLKDAFLIPGSGDEVLATMHEVSDEVVEVTPIEPADLRARFEWSIERTERTIPVVESETWPMCRPLVEWILGHLPAGGQAWEFPEWSQQQRTALVDDFIGSRFAKQCRLPTDEVASIVESFVWHGCDYGSGDPLRWSPIVVEIVLVDWFPRKVYGLSQTEIDAVPTILEQFVSFAHERCGVDAQATNETLSAIVVWEDDFFEAMADDDTDDDPGHGTDDSPLLRAIFGDRLGDDWMDEVTDELEQRVIELVGGRDAYDTLDDEPLRDIAFDWSVVPDDMAGLTGDTLEILDEWSMEHFDAEVRSIARVTLAGIVANDPSVFRRSARTDVLAAAILGYQIRRLTERFDRKEREAFGWTAATVSPFATAVGLTPATVGARVKTIMNVLDDAEFDWSNYLHSTQRRTALESKQRIAEHRAASADRD